MRHRVERCLFRPSPAREPQHGQTRPNREDDADRAKDVLKASRESPPRSRGSAMCTRPRGGYSTGKSRYATSAVCRLVGDAQKRLRDRPRVGRDTMTTSVMTTPTTTWIAGIRPTLRANSVVVRRVAASSSGCLSRSQSCSAHAVVWNAMCGHGIRPDPRREPRGFPTLAARRHRLCAPPSRPPRRRPADGCRYPRSRSARRPDPVSSSVSRVAPSWAVSSISRKPPGCAHCP